MKTLFQIILLAGVAAFFAGCCDDFRTVDVDTDGDGFVDDEVCSELVTPDLYTEFEDENGLPYFVLTSALGNLPPAVASRAAARKPQKNSPQEVGAKLFYFPAKVSLPISIRRQTAKGEFVLTKLKLGNKELINLARGRTINTPIPKSEYLLAGVAATEGGLLNTSLVVLDTADPTNEFAILTTTDGQLVFGKKDGIVAFGEGDLAAMSSPGFSIPTPAHLSFTTAGTNRDDKTSGLPSFKSKSLSVSGSITLVVDGETFEGVVLSGKVQTSGAPLAIATVPLP